MPDHLRAVASIRDGRRPAFLDAANWILTLGSGNATKSSHRSRLLQEQDLHLPLHGNLLGFTSSPPRSMTLHLYTHLFDKTQDGNEVNRHEEDVELLFEDQAVAQSNGKVDGFDSWDEALREWRDNNGRPSSLCILLNPVGGTRKASSIVQSQVEPMLKKAGVAFEVTETQYAMHASQIAREMDVSRFDGVVCVGGDGMLSEFVNGLLSRSDWQAAIQRPIGVIPAGTGNGISKTLLHRAGEEYLVGNAVFAIIRGGTTPFDVATVRQGAHRLIHSLINVNWGLIGDIDMESERYRWMGAARFDFQCLVRLVHLRWYHGTVHYLPLPATDESTAPPHTTATATATASAPDAGPTAVTAIAAAPTAASASAAAADTASLTATTVASLRPAEREGPSDCELVSQGGGGHDGNKEANEGYIGYKGPPWVQFHPKREGGAWETVEGPFVTVGISNVAWSNTTFHVAPNIKIDDGCVDLLMSRACHIHRLLPMVIAIGEGSESNDPAVLRVKTRALRFEPGPMVNHTCWPGGQENGGMVVVDGELVARGPNVTYPPHRETETFAYEEPFELCVSPGLLRVYAP